MLHHLARAPCLGAQVNSTLGVTMNAPRHTLRVMFALSVLVCSLIVLLIFQGRATPTNEFWALLLAASLAICALTCLFTFRGGRLLLAEVALSRFAGTFLLHLALAYVAVAAAITAISLAFALVVTGSAPDSVALAVLAGLWFSLWLAPGAASLTTWRKLSRHQEK